MSDEAPWFRELFDEVAHDVPDRSFARALEPWLPKAQEAMRELTHHREYQAARTSSVEELWQWYALSRVNDYLLLGFSPGKPRRWCDPTNHLCSATSRW